MVTLSLQSPQAHFGKKMETFSLQKLIVQNKKKKSVNTDIWKFTQRASQVRTWSYYNKAYLTRNLHTHTQSY